jgi:hypothetical protein
MREYAGMHYLDVWHARLDGEDLLKLLESGGTRRRTRDQILTHINAHTFEHLFPKLTEVVDGLRRFRDNPPLVFHPPEGSTLDRDVRRFLAHYRETLPDDRRTLFAHYHLADLAMKVVGVGSVGTRCAILLMMANKHDVLILQYKEAGASVLEPHLGKSKYKNHGQRVVAGQHLLQSASDMFLGWSSDEQGRDFYFRQLGDMKATVRIDDWSGATLTTYSELCGWALARAHAKAGDAAVISGYLGRSDSFDRACASFAKTYADQTERDHAAMVRAVEDGRLVAQTQTPH